MLSTCCDDSFAGVLCDSRVTVRPLGCLAVAEFSEDTRRELLFKTTPTAPDNGRLLISLTNSVITDVTGLAESENIGHVQGRLTLAFTLCLFASLISVPLTSRQWDGQHFSRVGVSW